MDCERNPDCKYFNSPTGCFTDTHEIYYPRRDYKTAIEKQFRKLGCNVVKICRRVHDEIHAQNPNGVPKPSREEMLQTIQLDRSRRDVGKSAEKAHEVQIVIEGLQEGIE